MYIDIKFNEKIIPIHFRFFFKEGMGIEDFNEYVEGTVKLSSKNNLFFKIELIELSLCLPFIIFLSRGIPRIQNGKMNDLFCN